MIPKHKTLPAVINQPAALPAHRLRYEIPLSVHRNGKSSRMKLVKLHVGNQSAGAKSRSNTVSSSALPIDSIPEKRPATARSQNKAASRKNDRTTPTVKTDGGHNRTVINDKISDKCGAEKTGLQTPKVDSEAP
ncbi:Uncharacterised protein [uncultured archaeon]|nr:Uncharacterised protein [uncultured archaeon]